MLRNAACNCPLLLRLSSRVARIMLDAFDVPTFQPAVRSVTRMVQQYSLCSPAARNESAPARGVPRRFGGGQDHLAIALGLSGHRAGVLNPLLQRGRPHGVTDSPT